ncbi:MAG: SGNH/GDSL hydrolase family protein [Magnetospirillum sp.]|nr:SGNH/GDSL hydrolase family protein [Magnetospirillum sp.]
MRKFRKSRQQNLGGNLALLTASVLLAFALCEVVIRQLPASDMMGWTMVPPAAARAAAAGEKRPGLPRILVLGDSFTEWRDNNGESYPRVAAQILAQSGQSVDVVNLAEAGTGLTEYMGNLLRHGPGLRPDLVLIGLYLGNDLVPSSPSLETTEGEAAARKESVRDGDRSPIWRLLKKSVALNYVYRLAKQRIPALRSGFFDQTLAYAAGQTGLDHASLQARLAEIDPALVDAARADAINGWDLAVAVTDPDYYGDLAGLEPGSKQGIAAEASFRDLRALIARARSLGAEVAVVLLPPPVWVAERYQEHFRRLGYGRLGPVAGELALISRLKAELSGSGVTAIDPLASLRDSAADTYLPRDIHPNRLGQRKIGEAVAAFLPDLLPAKAGPKAAAP